MSSSENLITPTVTFQIPLLSSKPVAPAITPAFTARRIQIPDPSDFDAPPFPLPLPPLTKSVAR